MEQQKIKDCLENGRTSLGVEFGSTRIKAVLIGEDHTPLASGAFSWENRLEDGVWTYRLEDAVAGLQSCYRELADSVFQKGFCKILDASRRIKHGFRVGKKLPDFLFC